MKVATVGSIISHGGLVTQGSPSTSADGSPVARVGDTVQCEQHGTTALSNGSSGVFADGIPICRVGDSVACGASVITGAESVFSS